MFALALYILENFFDEYVKCPEAGMRTIHYPEQQATAADQNVIEAHTDFKCFTLVTQDNCSGLEVLPLQNYDCEGKVVSVVVQELGYVTLHCSSSPSSITRQRPFAFLGFTFS